MGRFRKANNPLIRAAVDPNNGDAEIDESDDVLQPPSVGRCQVAETGKIQKRKTPLTTKIKAQFLLSMNRMSIFRSPEYRNRMEEELAVPKSLDPTSSTFGLIKTAINPTFRDSCLGNIWEHTDGISEKDEVRKMLIKEADENYLKSLKKGRFSLGSSNLRKELGPLRRSERLRNKKRKL